MLKGTELAAALREAMKLKGVTSAAVARHFGIKPPSVNGWRDTGRISKEHLDGLFNYFSDVVGPEHWGVTASRGRASAIDLPEISGGGPIAAGRPVPHFNVFGSMGDGGFLDHPHDIVKHISIDVKQLRRLVDFSAPENLSFITGLGDSMEPTFHDGDPLLIDTGVREHKIDAVYVLTVNDKLYIKTLQRRPDGSVLMISDNKKYDPYVIRESDAPVIHGRVLLAWNARRI